MTVWKVLLACLFAACVNFASAQTLSMMNVGPASAERVAQLCDNQGSAGGSGSTSFTFTTVNLCSPGSNRYIIIAVVGQSTGSTNPTALSVTVGGNAATQSVAPLAAGSSRLDSLFIILVPSGTNAAVVVTMTGGTTTNIAAGIVVWAIYGLNSITATNTTSGTGTAFSLAAPIGATQIVATSGNNNIADSYTWCSPVNSNNINSGAGHMSACIVNPTVTSPISGTITYGGGIGLGFVGASYF